MSGLIHKYADIQPHRDNERAHALLARFEQAGPRDVGIQLAGSKSTGAVVLIDSPGEPHCVLETVTSVGGLNAQTPSGVDYITEPSVVSCLYRAHPIFGDPNKWIQARKEIIEVLNDVGGAQFRETANGAVIMCPVRAMPVYVKELTFLQLYDTMRHLTQRFFQ